MTCKSLLVLFAACAVSFSAAAQSSLSLRGGLPDDNEAAEAALRRALLSQVASEEEVEKALSFMPDVVAEVNGVEITKHQIVELLLSKKISQQVLALTPESTLRLYMKDYVDQQIDTEILRQKAKEAGFIPSEELVKTQFADSIKKLPPEVTEELKDQLKARGLTLDEYCDEIAKEPDVQANASIAAYESKTFIDKAEKAVTDDEVEKFYRENQQKLFVVPENVTVAHILIQCEPVSALDSKEEKEIKAKADKLAKEQIDGIYDELVKNPASFDKLAQEKSNCPSGKRDNGKLPPFDKNGETLDGAGLLDPDFAAAAFNLVKPGDFTKPVHTQFGYHIIKLLKKDPKGYFPFEKVKQEIRDLLIDKTVSEEIQAMIKAERAKGDVKVFDFAPAKTAEKSSAEK